MSTILGKALFILMIGSTHYVDVGLEEDAVIYYESDTVTHMRLPNKPVMVGRLEMQENGYFVNWKDGPEGDWKISYEPGTFTYIGPDGKAAGNITKIVPGDSENLAK